MSNRWSCVSAALLSMLISGCAGTYSGSSTGSQSNRQVDFNGYSPQTGFDVALCAMSSAGEWVEVSRTTIDSSSVGTDSAGQAWYRYNAGQVSIPSSLWTTLPDTNDNDGDRIQFARLRHTYSHCSSGIHLKTFDTNQADGACNADIGSGWLNECATDKPIIVYKGGNCPSPWQHLGTLKERYDINEMPHCARRRVAGLISHLTGRSLIRSHYRINHLWQAMDADMGTEIQDLNIPCHGSGMTCYWGGFLQGHTNYLRNLELALYLYNEPWLPDGHLPYWNSATSVPSAFRFVKKPSGGGGCTGGKTSIDPGCTTWNVDEPTNWNFTMAAPSMLVDSNGDPSDAVCSMSVQELVEAIDAPIDGGGPQPSPAWHGSVHLGIGGAFRDKDSPSSPLFFAWHQYIENIYAHWRECR